MTDSSEYLFHIEAYTPETIPMARLATYMDQLAELLDEKAAVHFVRLDAGSTKLVHRIEREAVPKIERRLRAIEQGVAPKEVLRAYQRINGLLREDNAEGRYYDQTGNNIIMFPGATQVRPEFNLVIERGQIDGEIIKIGGKRAEVPVVVRDGTRELSGIVADRVIAKYLAHHLFDRVRLFGVGRWRRNEMTDWELQSFRVERFEIPDPSGLSATLARLQAVPGTNWGNDAYDAVIALRREELN